MNIFPIVVLYNVDFHESNVYRTLLSHYPKLRVLLYENSPMPQNKCYESDVVCYYHDSQNGGVSAAYNYGASIAKHLSDIDAVLLLDEDTKFEADYISILQMALSAHSDISLFVPQILYACSLPFSPIRRGFRWKRWEKLPEGVYKLDDYLPVNSGACIRLSAFEQVGGYNEDIRLDFADFDFFSRLGLVSDTFYRVGSVAHQSFSNDETETGKLFRRYQFYIEGARAARKNHHIKKMVDVEVLRHTLALTVRTKSFMFIKYLIK